MKRSTILPALMAISFFAGCDFSSWCSCSKKDKAPTEKASDSESKEPVKEAKEATPEQAVVKEEPSKKPIHQESEPVNHVMHKEQAHPQEEHHAVMPHPEAMPQEPAMPKIAAPQAAKPMVEEEDPMLEALHKAAIPKQAAPQATAPEEEENPMLEALEKAAAKK